MADSQILTRSLEKVFDVSFNVAGEEHSAVALERLSIRTNEELFKVPGDVIPLHRTPGDGFGIGHQGHRVIAGLGQLLFEEHEQRMGILAVHFQLLQKLKIGLEAISRSDIFQRKEDFFILAILLMSKLVAGSTQYHEPLIPKAGVQLVHLGVIPDCCTSK